MISGKFCFGITLTVLASGMLLMNGCIGKKNKEKIAEEMTEKILKNATGKDVDVKMQKGKIIIEGEGAGTELAETSTWPQDMFEDVPQFTLGKIERVHKTHESGGMQKFNIFFIDIEEDALNKYSNALKKSGWQTSIMQMGDKAGMLNAQKGNLALNFPLSLEKKTGTLMVYTTQ